MARRTSAGNAASPTQKGVKRNKPLGSVRRAQQITTYGVGSMIAIGDQSYIVSGLDSWGVDDEPDLHEPRLEQRLRVGGFHLPPAAPAPTGDGVKVRRFPQTYSCTTCQDLKFFRDFGTRRNMSVCGSCGSPLTPSRFVVACEQGHLDEFPYWAWVHAPRRGESRAHRHCDRRKAQLRLKSEGRTASLQGIVISCDCGESASMEGAFGRDAMASYSITCRGMRPWLGREARQDNCAGPLRVLQRGSSAAWFPEVRSALSIPPWHDELMQQVMGQKKNLLDEDDQWIARIARKQGWLDDGKYTVEDVLERVHALEDVSRELPDEDPEEIVELEAGSTIRQEEFRQLCAETQELPGNHHFVCVPPVDAGDDEIPGIDRTMLVKRLREVRALESFARIEPLMRTEKDRERAARLSLGEEISWLPAIEVIGEGVFLTLDETRLSAWESAEGPYSPARRVQRIRRNHERELRRRAGDRQTRADSPVTTRFVLLHTLAHALINEWSLDCGYPASALRERLYVNKDMAGVLLYTATSDSAGSLGGIIAQGEPKRLATSLHTALERVSWCSADPLCMEADASGVDSLNLAACHSCVLLPETSCETNNVFLDRALLVGTPDGGTPGFFS